MSRIEVWLQLGQIATKSTEMRPPRIVYGTIKCLHNKFTGKYLSAPLYWRGGWYRSGKYRVRYTSSLHFRLHFRCRGGSRRSKYFSENELVASIPERLRCLLFPKPKNVEALFPQTNSKPCEIAIASDQTETIEFPGVQQVHRINNHRTVGSIFARGVCKLLHGFY